MADKIKDDSERVAAYSGETVVERFVKEITANVADDLAYRGLTLRQWADKIVSGEYAPVVHGHWRKSKEGVCGDYLFVCSACGADYWESPSYYKQAHYCPNCGAKMDKNLGDFIE